jgi:hypothetical protein
MTVDIAAIEDAAWRQICSPDTAKGALRWKLDDHQLRIYDPYRAWEARRLQELDAGQTSGAHRVFMADCGRQVGKTFTTSVIRAEDAHAFCNETILVASATEVALKELLIPVLNTVFAGCPEELRPKFFSSRWGMRAGYFCPASDSVIKLVGVDKDPDGLRGPGLSGATITEAAFVRKLGYAVSGILYPQFSRRPHATCILESSAPAELMHDFDRVFKPDCESRKAYVFMTMWDNSTLSQETKKELFESAYAIDPDDAEREYNGKRGMNRLRAVIPEFDRARHVEDRVKPNEACAIAAFDPGIKDLFAIVWGYWDPSDGKLVVHQDWSCQNATTGHVATIVRSIERTLYGEAAEIHRPRKLVLTPEEEKTRLLKVLSGQKAPDIGNDFGLRRPDGMTWWSGESYRSNPLMRVSDTEARLILDLNATYSIPCVPADKDGKQAAVLALRNAFRDDQIVITPHCDQLISTIENGRWNDKRTDFERHLDKMGAKMFGHLDLLSALIYLWRMGQVIRNINPIAPKYIDKHGPDLMHKHTWAKTEDEGASWWT